jgi:hypothetical protein
VWRILLWKPEGKSFSRRPRRRWYHNNGIMSSFHLRLGFCFQSFNSSSGNKVSGWRRQQPEILSRSVS